MNIKLIDIQHSEDRASWYILTMKANEMRYFPDLFDKIQVNMRASEVN